MTAFTVKIMANLRLKVNIFPLLSPETFFFLLFVEGEINSNLAF